MSPGPAPRGARQPACPVSFLDAQTLRNAPSGHLPSPGLAGRVAGLRPARARVRAETVGVPGFGDVMLVRLNLPSRAATSKLVAHELLKLDPAGARWVRRCNRMADARVRCARPCRRRPDNFLQISVRHHTRVTFFQTPLWSLLIVHIFVMRLVPSSVGPSPSQLDLELLREIAKRLGRPREQLVVVLVVVERS